MDLFSTYSMFIHYNMPMHIYNYNERLVFYSKEEKTGLE